jgi:phosphate/sulfate permease
MPTDFYFWIVVILLLLAVVDLVVGVSNDAVNFLNSAIGSKVATRRTIMVVASLGILIGATFSSGMMEVARKGIFNPTFFSFADIMIVFLAVMLTDILLLDLFNTFGMPTSTTVSIVFELLGAAVAVALFRILDAGDSLSTLAQYINASSTIAIVSGIFLSITIAFIVGGLVQWFSRFLFTFYFEKHLKWFGAIWSGLALAVLSYFLLFKGLKGASFMDSDTKKWIANYTIHLLLISFVVWSVVMQLLQSVFKINVLRLVVLFGTFSLAMAFAGNDLVNFIGVPLAGLESYFAWEGSHEAPGSYLMVALSEPVRTNTYILLLAGLIMIATLWFSKKAQTVTDTEVNLARQEDGSERFQSNLLARAIVWNVRKIGSLGASVIPNSWREKIESRFAPLDKEGDQENAPAFDLIRASVNLTTAASLIALATSLKLPLSTTYVSFMVAMGTSLADRAWGRGSAVFRIAGVLNVIGGWFLTAIIAFFTAAVFAVVLKTLGLLGVVILVSLAVYTIIRTFLHHKRQVAEDHEVALESSMSAQYMVETSGTKVAKLLRSVSKAYESSVAGVVKEDLGLLKEAKSNLQKLQKRNEAMKKHLFKIMKQLPAHSTTASHLYLLMYDLEQDLLQSSRQIVHDCDDYVQNSLPALTEEQQYKLTTISSKLHFYLNEISERIATGGMESLSDLQAVEKEIDSLLESALTRQIQGLRAGAYGLRNSNFLFAMELETRDLMNASTKFAQIYLRMQKVIEEQNQNEPKA